MATAFPALSPPTADMPLEPPRKPVEAYRCGFQEEYCTQPPTLASVGRPLAFTPRAVAKDPGSERRGFPGTERPAPEPATRVPLGPTSSARASDHNPGRGPPFSFSKIHSIDSATGRTIGAMIGCAVVKKSKIQLHGVGCGGDPPESRRCS
jgi:hypothetical protein